MGWGGGGGGGMAGRVGLCVYMVGGGLPLFLPAPLSA